MYLLALTLLLITIVTGESGYGGASDTFGFSSLIVLGIAVLRTLWFVWRNPSSVARKAGGLAAKGANHVDTLILPPFAGLLKPPVMRTSCLAAGPLSSVAQTSLG